MQRQLAAILFADVAGYTRLLDVYEQETHPRLLALFNEVIDPAIATETGRVVKYTGDGFLACFASVNSAIKAAIEILQETHRREADRPDDRRIAFRMGLHSGDITIEDRDVYGAGVNLAARLQELAEPGRLLISGAVREQLGSNLGLATVDLGYMQLKNIANEVRVFEVDLFTEARLPTLRSGAQARSHSPPSIAVCPVTDFGADTDESYFGDGLVEDIVGALASLPDFVVISRSSTLKYRGRQPDLRGAAQELGVRYVLSGNIRRGNERLRISAGIGGHRNLNGDWSLPERRACNEFVSLSRIGSQSGSSRQSLQTSALPNCGGSVPQATGEFSTHTITGCAVLICFIGSIGRVLYRAANVPRVDPSRPGLCIAVCVHRPVAQRSLWSGVVDRPSRGDEQGR